ncbi:hypothetical protein J4E83_005604 [Alternaria metachromatica]|uniref:uncharacterized protein n=1 Tax=Alternaria metachromatica TaxID=283354 RepID=UPI0020C527BC|nr:uncharacterized protein J4E83_005604 [Alternaria metachromatica]KAI4619748.1 hypothetical protein J4E83_005604 [Alternaria metachromatica]
MAGRGNAKTIANERAARIKATKQRVFISGLKGDHTLETGVAYHYRGHFIYAYPVGNPIEPVPFSTKKGINIVGVVTDQAPLYDSKKPDLVLESTVAALQRSCVHEWEWQKEQEEIKKQETKKALEEEKAGERKTGSKVETETLKGSAKDIDAAVTPKASAQDPLPSQAPSRVPSFTRLLVPSQVSSNLGSRSTSRSRPAPPHRTSSSSANVPRIGTVEAPPTTSDSSQSFFPSTSYTPHDRGHYLAYSAPGSRNASVDNTPFVSRPVSPTHQHGLSIRNGQSHTSLRPIASTSRLNQLLAAEGIRRSLSPLTDVAEGGSGSGTAPHHAPQWQEEDMVANLSVSQGWMDPSDISAFVETVSRRPTPSPSRLSSRSHTPSRFRSSSPRDTSPDDGGGSGLYLHGLGHPDVIRKSRAQTRENSPFRAPDYRSKESAVYLRGLAQRDYETGDTGYELNAPARQEGGGHPASSVQSSRAQTPIGQVPVGLRGGSDQQRDTTLPFSFPPARAPDTSSFPAFIDHVPSPSYIVQAEKKPLNTGRPRAASKALNEAYNAANPSSTPRPVFSFPSPDEQTEGNDTGVNADRGADTENAVFTARCPIHSESCNGQDVVHTYITERARNGAGFKDLFPTIECEDGRVMVDWARMKDEEMEKLRA